MSTRIIQQEPAEEISEALIELLRTRTVGVTASAFDLPHPGHAIMLRESKEYLEQIARPGHDPLFLLFLQHDPSIDRAGKNRPVMTFTERFIMLSAFIYPDYIVGYHTEQDLLRNLKILEEIIAVRFIGADWKAKEYTGKQLSIPIFWNERNHSYSTTDLRRRVYLAEVARQEAERDHAEFPTQLAA